MGIFTSFGSYNPIRKPIIMDNLIIALSNSCFSFVAGFGVWAIIGYLNKINNMAGSSIKSMGLVFIAYPTAIDTMTASNFWIILLALTLFTLGIDSAFSMVEATATVINDTKWGSQYPKSLVAFVLCLLGFILSIPFCTNWGFVLFDVIDHYLAAFLLIIVGIFQCLGCGWGFDAENTMEKSIGHRKGLVYLSLTFWGLLILLGIVFPLIEMTGVGIAVFVACFIFIGLIPSFCLSKLSFNDWYNDICMCGVRKLAYSMTMLGRSNPAKQEWYEAPFAFYWGFCVKYFIPTALWFILVNQTILDIKKPYGGYATHWQIIGVIVPVIGLLAFILAMFINVYEEPFDKAQFEDVNAAVGGENNNKVSDSGNIEMADSKEPVAVPAEKVEVKEPEAVVAE